MSTATPTTEAGTWLDSLSVRTPGKYFVKDERTGHIYDADVRELSPGSGICDAVVHGFCLDYHSPVSLGLHGLSQWQPVVHSRITLSMPQHAEQKLLAAYERKDPELMEILQSLGVIAILPAK